MKLFQSLGGSPPIWRWSSFSVGPLDAFVLWAHVAGVLVVIPTRHKGGKTKKKQPAYEKSSGIHTFHWELTFKKEVFPHLPGEGL